MTETSTIRGVHSIVQKLVQTMFEMHLRERSSQPNLHCHQQPEIQERREVHQALQI